jgi:hypothetical protein
MNGWLVVSLAGSMMLGSELAVAQVPVYSVNDQQIINGGT